MYEEVDDNDQKVICLRRVLSQMYKDSGIVYKARPVARGFEEEHLNELRKDSPTCCKVSFWLVVSIIATNMWTNHSVDVKSAFLQGKEINRDVYVKPPQEAETDKLWKLKTTVYGLCDAPRVWYLSVKGVLLKAGAVKSKFDDSVFYWQKVGKLEGLISWHVDDFFWGGTKSFKIYVIDVLKKSFVTSQEKL